MKNWLVNKQRILFGLILFILAAPFINNITGIVTVDALSGAIVIPEATSFNLSKWFSGDYQLEEEKYVNETFGFRNFFIKINNQIAFSLFRKPYVNGVIIGKKDYLYEENYLKAYYGTDFIGTDSINHRMNRLKFIHDTLNKLNKTMIIIFAPGKGSFYPEYFPDDQLRKKSITNYEYHLERSKQLGLNCIDFQRYFIENKNKSAYPLYPKFGIHWSNYGMCLVIDSVIHYIEKKRSIDMPEAYWHDIKLGDADKTDYDIGAGMNLLFKLPYNELAYPVIQFEEDATKQKPSVLVISDSFFRGIHQMGIFNAFSNSHFWYYNKEIYQETDKLFLKTSQVDLKDEIAKHDIVMLMCTDANLPKLGWGFIENTYDMFHGDTLQQ